ncbi:MAG: hypothetical protein ACI87O_000400 [Planctomycetota bacterium]|jgi:hypothetical protein
MSIFHSTHPTRFGYAVSAEQRKLVQALVLVLMVTLAGTIGFVRIEGWDQWKAFYFTLTTITSVGYEDEGISDSGKKLATLLRTQFP